MAVNQTFNGVPYPIPSQGDLKWGPPLTRYLVALGSFALAPSGGAFTLTSDVNFGGTFGLLAPYFTSVATNPATMGVLRLPKNGVVAWRNNANSNNLFLGINGSDQLTFNGVLLATNGGGTVNNGTQYNLAYYAANGTAISPTGSNLIYNSATNQLQLTGGGIIITDSLTIGNNSNGLVIGNGVSTSKIIISTANTNDGPRNVGFRNAGTDCFFVLSEGSQTINGNLTLTNTNTFTNTQTFSKALVYHVSTLATSGTITPDATLGPTFTISVSGAVTLNGPSNGVDGQKVTFRIINDASHSVTLATTATNFRFGTDITGYTNSVSKTDYIGAIWNNGASFWDVVSVIQGF